MLAMTSRAGVRMRCSPSPRKGWRASGGRPSAALRRPWLVAFGFGLLHGFGFAGALAEVGLPHHAIPIALLFFNIGVEVGQLAFVAMVLTLGVIMHSVMRLCLEPASSRRAVSLIDVFAAYAIGTVASFWLIERTSALFV